MAGHLPRWVNRHGATTKGSCRSEIALERLVNPEDVYRAARKWKFRKCRTLRVLSLAHRAQAALVFIARPWYKIVVGQNGLKVAWKVHLRDLREFEWTNKSG